MRGGEAESRAVAEWGDWDCPRCGNSNYSRCSICNVRDCGQPKPTAAASIGAAAGKDLRQISPGGAADRSNAGGVELKQAGCIADDMFERVGPPELSTHKSTHTAVSSPRMQQYSNEYDGTAKDKYTPTDSRGKADGRQAQTTELGTVCTVNKASVVGVYCKGCKQDKPADQFGTFMTCDVCRAARTSRDMEIKNRDAGSSRRDSTASGSAAAGNATGGSLAGGKTIDVSEYDPAQPSDVDPLDAFMDELHSSGKVTKQAGMKAGAQVRLDRSIQSNLSQASEMNGHTAFGYPVTHRMNCQPAQRWEPDWIRMHTHFVQQAEQQGNQANVLFLGDSIFECWLGTRIGVPRYGNAGVPEVRSLCRLSIGCISSVLSFALCP